MKIISKYKDYYDYLSGVYGVDEKIILDRRKFGSVPTMEGKIELRICGRGIEGWYSEETKQFYYGSDIGNAPGATYHPPGKYRWSEKYPSYSFISKGFWRDNVVVPMIFTDGEKVNEKEKCPIVMKYAGKWVHYPILHLIGLNKFLPAKDIYLMLCEWLAPKDIVADKQTDKEKAVSKGFTKESFRNTKHRLK